jgi:hypothetical protein
MPSADGHPICTYIYSGRVWLDAARPMSAAAEALTEQMHDQSWTARLQAFQFDLQRVVRQ